MALNPNPNPNPNPFETMHDTLRTLESLGTNPLRNQSGGTLRQDNWQEHVLSVQVTRNYGADDPSFWDFKTLIHISEKGFMILHRILGTAYVRESFIDRRDQLIMRPAAGIEVMAIVDRPKDKEVYE